jgi:23S rRNA-intervening sequence protein
VRPGIGSLESFSFFLDRGGASVEKILEVFMKKSEQGAPVVVGKAYDFILWLLPKVENFPKAHRFTVGDRLTSHGLDLLTSLVEAAYSRDKADLLDQASRKVNSTRLLLRMAKDLKLMSLDAYRFSAENLDEIGRMVGGWSKAAVKA